MDSKYYCQFFEDSSIPQAVEALGDIWILFHDEISANRADNIKNWLQANDLHVLDCLAKSPDLSIIDNVRGILWQGFKKYGRQFEDVDSLQN